MRLSVTPEISKSKLQQEGAGGNSCFDIPGCSLQGRPQVRHRISKLLIPLAFVIFCIFLYCCKSPQLKVPFSETIFHESKRE